MGQLRQGLLDKWVGIPVKCLRPLLWRHNGRDCVSNQPRDCLLNRLFRRRSKQTSKLCVTGLCAGNSPGTGEFTAQMASNAENVSIWWRHHALSGQHVSNRTAIMRVWGGTAQFSNDSRSNKSQNAISQAHGRSTWFATIWKSAKLITNSPCAIPINVQDFDRISSKVANFSTLIHGTLHCGKKSAGEILSPDFFYRFLVLVFCTLHKFGLLFFPSL